MGALVPQDSVLLAIDVQNGFVCGRSFPRLRAGFGPTLARVNKATGRWLAGGGAVVATRFVNTTDSPLSTILGWKSMDLPRHQQRVACPRPRGPAWVRAGGDGCIWLMCWSGSLAVACSLVCDRRGRLVGCWCLGRISTSPSPRCSPVPRPLRKSASSTRTFTPRSVTLPCLAPCPPRQPAAPT